MPHQVRRNQLLLLVQVQLDVVQLVRQVLRNEDLAFGLLVLEHDLEIVIDNVVDRKHDILNNQLELLFRSRKGRGEVL